nr:MAG TPA: hypothetical protein [Caudoviricetes sp.]
MLANQASTHFPSLYFLIKHEFYSTVISGFV